MVVWCSETGRESLTSGLALALCCAIVSEKMSKLFQDVKVADGRRIDATKAALLDWLIAEKQMLQTQLKVWRGDFCEQRRLICVNLACFDGCFGMWCNKQLTEQAITSVKYMDRERDTTEWVSENQFLVRLEVMSRYVACNICSSLLCARMKVCLHTGQCPRRHGV
jgi:hypothetical protein